MWRCATFRLSSLTLCGDCGCRNNFIHEVKVSCKYGYFLGVQEYQGMKRYFFVSFCKFWYFDSLVFQMTISKGYQTISCRLVQRFFLLEPALHSVSPGITSERLASIKGPR